MARVRLVLDTRKTSKSKSNGLYPVAIRLFHKKQKFIRLPYATSINGWDEKNNRLKKSAAQNKTQDCEYINKMLVKRLFIAKKLIDELSEAIEEISAETLSEHIKLAWTESENSPIKHKIQNNILLGEWSDVLIHRKMVANQAGTAKWYKGAVAAIKKYNNGKDIKLYDINVTFLKNFQAHHEHLGNSANGISSYLRALRSIYNSAIKEDKFTPVKHAFEYYKIPRTHRTKKKAISKEDLIKIRDLNYEKDSDKWHTKNYIMIMFNCRGMNLIDLAKLRFKNIQNDRLYYGRSKTGEPLSVKITTELNLILKYYVHEEMENEDFLFPIGYDGSQNNYKHYLSHRRRINKQLKVIAADAGIKENFTTYSIRHSWATIAKYMGVPIEVISEGLGHNSLRTTEIYLKNFHDDVLDKANEMIVK